MTKPLIVITGASSGIGATTARLLSEQGHPLLLLARRVERLQQLDLPNTFCAKADVTDVSSMRDAIDKAEEQFGKVDCLINNAGVMHLGLTAEQDPSEWKRMLDVNVMGMLNGIHLVLNDMIERREGTIINISSIAGHKPFDRHVAYCGTKYAVSGLTETLRQEVSQSDVRVITISPGIVETELLSHTTSQDFIDDYQDVKKQIGEVLKPEDIAQAILYAYQQPQSVCIREIVLAPTKQAQ